MAQATSGFPWQSQSQEEEPVISEKLPDIARDSSSRDDTLTDLTNRNSKSHPTRVPTEKSRHGSKSRKRAASAKVPQSVIPQTREELDEHLSYGPSRHFNVRTIPPWIHDAEEDDIVDINVDDVLDSPHAALVAQHNSSPANASRSAHRTHHFTSSGTMRPDKTSRWVTFARASAYPRETFDGEKVDAAWLDENFTDYSQPWLASQNEDAEKDGSRYHAFKRKRKGWYKRMQFTILRNPFVPLAFRFTVLVFAAIAMALGASIYHEAGLIEACKQTAASSRPKFCVDAAPNGDIDYNRDPSALMAVIVDAIAIVYLIYITYDEYFSKPLGLRPARAKVRLVLLDLFFIVFQSANLSLAFESLTVDEGACAVGSRPATSYRFDRICDRAEALSSVLLVSLVAWLFTFSVSVLRLVERINAR